MRSVTWNRSETVRGSESEEAAVRDCFFFLFFPKGALTHHLPAGQAVIPSCVGSCAPPESIAFS